MPKGIPRIDEHEGWPYDIRGSVDYQRMQLYVKDNPEEFYIPARVGEDLGISRQRARTILLNLGYRVISKVDAIRRSKQKTREEYAARVARHRHTEETVGDIARAEHMNPATVHSYEVAQGHPPRQRGGSRRAPEGVRRAGPGRGHKRYIPPDAFEEALEEGVGETARRRGFPLSTFRRHMRDAGYPPGTTIGKHRVSDEEIAQDRQAHEEGKSFGFIGQRRKRTRQAISQRLQRRPPPPQQ